MQVLADAIGGKGREPGKGSNLRLRPLIWDVSSVQEYFISWSKFTAFGSEPHGTLHMHHRARGNLCDPCVIPEQDPLAIIGILGIFLPFIILGIAIATGYVDVSNYR